MNGCDDIQFSNCTFNTNAVSTSTNYAGVVASGSVTSATSGGIGVSNLLLENNTFNGGYYGVVLYGQSANPMTTNHIIGNTFNEQYYYGAYLAYNDQPVISGNTFNGRLGGTTTVSSRAIHFLTAYGPWEISKNKIINQGLYGIYMSGSSSATTSSLIANNMIGGGFTSTSTTASGIYITSSNNINIWYNSVLMDGVAGRGIYFLSGLSNIDFRNNTMSFTGTGAGYAYYSAATTMFTQHNYNNYYSTGSNFVYYGVARANLAALQAANQPVGNDANSISGDPFYYSVTDLHASTTHLWGSGTPIAQVSDDIDGDPRDPVSPCIGADEYVPAAVDAAVIMALEPSSGCGLGTSELVGVQLKNMGLDTLFTMSISYSINGGLPVTEIWNDTLVVGSYLDYTFTQTADFSAPGTYQIFFEVDAAGDALPFNDTLTYLLRTGHDFYSSNYFMGFEPGEDYSQWTVVDVNNDGRTWEPGYNSTTYANTGTRSARFYNGTTNPGNDYLFSECFYLEAGTTYKVEFWHRVESANYPQSIDLVVATDVTPASVIDTLVQLPLFINTIHEEAVGLFSPPADGVYYFGWYAYSPSANWYAFIDDINIRILAPLDAGVTAISNVDDMEDAGTSLVPHVTVKNFGSQTLTSVTVLYSVNGGTPVSETWTGSIDSDEEDTYIFTTPFTVPEGTYTICAWTDLTGDGNPGNDETCVNKYGLPVLSIPYFDDFEGTSYWYIDGTGNQWQFGQPTASIINNAYSPVNVWATNLSGNYGNNSSYYLYTPKFDFTTVNNVAMGFWHWIESESGVDGGKVQYSTNDGVTWQTLGVLNDPTGTNWYNAGNINNAPGFSGSSGGWQYSEISLTAFDYFPLPVQFRFHFFSNASVNNNGWAIDDFTLYQPQIPNDVGVIEITAPAGQSVTGGQNQVIVKLKNYGTVTQTSIPVSYKAGGAPPVNATWTGSLDPGDEVSYTFATPFTGPFTSTFELCSWTSLSGDTYDFNDTTCVTLTAGPANTDGGVVSILSPTGQTIGGSNVTVSIRVENFGLQALNNIPVQYSLDGVVQSTEIVLGSLAPGSTADYTFTTTFVSPSDDYELCAKTAISGDAIVGNDQFCADLTTGIDETTLEGLVLLQNVPNPATDETVIGFYLPGSGKLTFSITNLLGEVIYSETGDYSPGRHEVMVNTKSMAAGLYYYSITFDQHKLTRKMIIQ
jgi:parallel beta-helix repeat protein